MGLRIKALSLFLLFLFISFASSGIADGFSERGHAMHGTNPPFKKLEEVEVRMNHRKLMSGKSMLDYDEAGPNPKHDPRRRGPGGRP